MKKSEVIKDLYFNKKYTQTEIAKQLDITKPYISKILTQDNRYKQEKEKRIALNRKKNKEYTKKYIKTKRRDSTLDYLIMKREHEQASIEMSDRKKLTNMAYRNWNTSAYKYNETKKRFEFKKGLGRSYDVPKTIKVELR